MMFFYQIKPVYLCYLKPLYFPPKTIFHYIEIIAQNKLIITSNDTLHFNSKGQKVKKLRELSCKAVKDRFGSFKKAKFNSKKQCGVTLTVFYPTNRRSDPDNLQPTLKAILDGFTDSGLLTDDNHQVVVYTKYCYGGLSGTTGYKLEVEFDKVNS